MKRHEAERRLAGIKPSLRGKTDAEKAVLYEARADSAYEREFKDRSREDALRSARAAEAAGKLIPITEEDLGSSTEIPVRVTDARHAMPQPGAEQPIDSAEHTH